MDVLRTIVSALSFYDPEEKMNHAEASLHKAVRLTSQIAYAVAATLSDMHSAVTATIGALKGSLHGGANEAVFRVLEAVGSSGSAPVAYVKGILVQNKKIPGFGHRGYHTGDPRATHLRRMSRELGNSVGVPKRSEMSRRIEDYVVSDRRLNANVDICSASTYHSLGIDVDLFATVLAVSRLSGWMAHLMEQPGDNRLIRPRAG